MGTGAALISIICNLYSIRGLCFIDSDTVEIDIAARRIDAQLIPHAYLTAMQIKQLVSDTVHQSRNNEQKYH